MVESASAVAADLFVRLFTRWESVGAVELIPIHAAGGKKDDCECFHKIAQSEIVLSRKRRHDAGCCLCIQ
jgi:hypothetical protein